MSEWGNPSYYIGNFTRVRGERTQGSETSQYLEEKIPTDISVSAPTIGRTDRDSGIPRVAASETGTAQTEYLYSG